MTANQQHFEKKKVLFVCRHNAARSQMAEAILKMSRGNRYEAYSAGTETSAVHPMTISVLQEIGIDCSGCRAKSLDELAGTDFDLVVTLCDQARESCPYVPGAAVMHMGFDNPADASGTDAETLEVFRKVREDISQWIEKEFT
jgi:arsenate reductase